MAKLFFSITFQENKFFSNSSFSLRMEVNVVLTCNFTFPWVEMGPSVLCMSLVLFTLLVSLAQQTNNIGGSTTLEKAIALGNLLDYIVTCTANRCIEATSEHATLARFDKLLILSNENRFTNACGITNTPIF